ncbi:MAG TPA: hypothetical protein VLB81_16770 [Gaiellales bacterium]|nr:hypothetical protein [Gaiellales bacterium]
MATATMGDDRGGTMRIGLTGWGAFGAVTLIVLGGLNIINGFTAIHNSSYFARDHIVYHNLTVWGWVFLIWGILQLVAGALVFAHSVTGYYMGVCLAGTATILWFFMLFAAPIPAMVGVIVGLIVVYSMTVGSQDAFSDA